MELVLLYSSTMLLLLLSSQGLHATEGRGLHHQINKEPPKQVQVGEKGLAMSEALIGSRPPRCEGKCALCGRCEAVQVPVAPRGKREAGRSGLFFFAAVSERVGDESSTNYKPLNWKCRCADTRVVDP